MADLSITAANVLAGSGARTVNGTAGATITAGQVVYKDTADSKYKLADSNSATAAVRGSVGVSLNGAANGQPLRIAAEGPVTIGATMVAGTVYALSETPGGIQPVADLASGEEPVILGVATSTTVLELDIADSGVTL
jgi:hypothetical protein